MEEDRNREEERVSNEELQNSTSSNGSGNSPAETESISPALISEIEESFSELDLVQFEIYGSKFELISLSELPMDSLVKIAKSSGRNQVELMREYIHFCLVNPKQWDLIETMNFHHFTAFVKSWMLASGAAEDSDDGDEYE